MMFYQLKLKIIEMSNPRHGFNFFKTKSKKITDNLIEVDYQVTYIPHKKKSSKL